MKLPVKDSEERLVIFQIRWTMRAISHEKMKRRHIYRWKKSLLVRIELLARVVTS